MPLIINQIRCPVNLEKDEIINRALKSVGLSGKENNAAIYKTSLDARRQDIKYVHSVIVTLGSAREEEAVCRKYPDVHYAAEPDFSPTVSSVKRAGRVCIAGFGPAGIFCALALAEKGYRPLVLEKGGDMDSRTMAVKRYWDGGELDENSNVQFGEGGAGTFSDGKLTTRIKDPLCRYVLKRLTEFGAPAEILTKAKPHIGTDNLRGVIKAIRRRIISLGGEVRFLTPLTDIHLNGGEIDRIAFTGGECECSALVAAVGHSAGGFFELLGEKGIFMEPKPFSVGVRIEHLQKDVDLSLYGAHAGDPLLPKGEYQLSCRMPSGRAAYTFCMCPGGVVVPAASEYGTVVTNGMSEFARDGENANCAIAVSVSPNDTDGGVFGGLKFIKDIERRAFVCGGGIKAPATDVGGFLSGRPSLNTKITPSYSRGVAVCELRDIFPRFVTDMLEIGLGDFSKKMKCFRDTSAVLTAPETRTSSPIRITRNEKGNSVSVGNLFPCGEGAGYAGGIISAAVDGLKTAAEIMSRQSP